MLDYHMDVHHTAAAGMANSEILQDLRAYEGMLQSIIVRFDDYYLPLDGAALTHLC